MVMWYYRMWWQPFDNTRKWVLYMIISRISFGVLKLCPWILITIFGENVEKLSTIVCRIVSSIAGKGRNCQKNIAFSHISLKLWILTLYLLILAAKFQQHYIANLRCHFFDFMFTLTLIMFSEGKYCSAHRFTCWTRRNC